MKRKIVSIDEALCNGCELCVTACHEGAIAMVNGRAKLISDIYCDGLGDCLPACPTGAIQIVERDADPFDEVAVQARMAEIAAQRQEPISGGCPGMRSMSLNPEPKQAAANTALGSAIGAAQDGFRSSQLRQWPVQLHLLNPQADYLKGSHLLLAADCTAYACAGFHEQYLEGRTLAIACPKLDDPSGYVEKLAQILAYQEIQSLTILRMVVPCCSGLTQLARQAVRMSGTTVPVEEVVVELNGSEVW